MTRISFGNLNNAQMTPEMEKRLQSQENFTAIDTQKLKQDTVELTKKAGKENFIFKIMRSFGVEDPKKTLKALGMTLLTVVGFALIGNKTSNLTAKLGLSADDLLKKDGFKWLNSIGNGLKKAKKNVGSFLTKHFKSADDIATTLSDPAKKIGPKNAFARSSCSGVKYQFASAVIESMQGIFYGGAKNIAKNFDDILIDGKKINKKAVSEILARADIDTIEVADLTSELKITGSKANEFINAIKKQAQNDKTLLSKMVGEGNALKTYQTVVNDNAGDRVEFVKELTKNIKSAHGLEDDDHKGLLEIFEQIQKGEGDFAPCKDINMIHGMDSWGTTNWIDTLGKKIFKDKWKNISKANVGSTLIKFNATSGELADSGLGRAIQGFPTIFTESVSNYVCDMAFINSIVIPTYIELFKNVQDAPKEQKVATVADEFISGVGHLTVVLPTAGAITYGVASLGNLEGKGVLSKILKPVGKFFGMGLGNKPAKGFFGHLWKGTKGFLGGAGRFVFITFILSSIIKKPFDILTKKIFGEPYNKEEAEKLKQLEEQKKQVIPELGITQGELMEKMQKNPQAIMKLQQDVKLAQEIDKNPKLLLDLLDGKEIQISPAKAHQGLMSPINQNLINNQKQMVNNSNNMNLFEKNKKQTQIQNNSPDVATYIPSSAPVKAQSTLSNEQLSEYNELIAKSDKILKKAEQYI